MWINSPKFRNNNNKTKGIHQKNNIKKFAEMTSAYQEFSFSIENIKRIYTAKKKYTI